MRAAKTLKVELASDRTLLISGPASVKLVEGRAEVLGGALNPDMQAIIRKERQIPLQAISRCVFELSVGEKASTEIVDGTTIPSSWYEAVDSVLQLKHGRILVIGNTDTGKSSFCTFLANRIVASTTNVTVLDGDVGQTDMGPPTTLAAGKVDSPVLDLSHILPFARVFIGDTSPGRSVSKTIQGFELLLQKSSGLTIINTDGWVEGNDAVRYKLHLIDTVRPTMIIGLARGDELDDILNMTRFTALRVEPSSFARKRTKEERRLLREAAYRRFLQNSKRLSLDLNCVDIHEVDSKHYYVEAGHTALNGSIGPIIGILNDEGLLEEIGILLGLDRYRKRIRIYTKPRARISRVEVGNVILSINGDEVGYVE